MNILLCNGDRIEGRDIILIEGKSIDMTEDKKPTLLLTPKGSISKTDKARLSNNGYIVVEVADPSQVKTISDLGMIGTDLISVAAIETLGLPSTNDPTKVNFAQKILAKSIAKINSAESKSKV